MLRLTNETIAHNEPLGLGGLIEQLSQFLGLFAAFLESGNTFVGAIPHNPPMIDSVRNFGNDVVTHCESESRRG